MHLQAGIEHIGIYLSGLLEFLEVIKCDTNTIIYSLSLFNEKDPWAEAAKSSISYPTWQFHFRVLAGWDRTEFSRQ